MLDRKKKSKKKKSSKSLSSDVAESTTNENEMMITSSPLVTETITAVELANAPEVIETIETPSSKKKKSSESVVNSPADSGEGNSSKVEAVEGIFKEKEVTSPVVSSVNTTKKSQKKRK